MSSLGVSPTGASAEPRTARAISRARSLDAQSASRSSQGGVAVLVGPVVISSSSPSAGTRGARAANGFLDGVEPIGQLIDLFLDAHDQLTHAGDVLAGWHVDRLEVGPHVVSNRLLCGEHGLEHLSARLAELGATHRLV